GGGGAYRLDPEGTPTTGAGGGTGAERNRGGAHGALPFYRDPRGAPPRGGTLFYENDTGRHGLGPPRPHSSPAPGGPARAAAGNVVPDGLVVGSEGCLWVALWGGSEVRRYSPTGGLLATLPVPVSQPTCPAFGGPDLSDLYLTTAWQGLDEKQRAAEPLAGH